MFLPTRLSGWGWGGGGRKGATEGEASVEHFNLRVYNEATIVQLLEKVSNFVHIGH